MTSNNKPSKINYYFTSVLTVEDYLKIDPHFADMRDKKVKNHLTFYCIKLHCSEMLSCMNRTTMWVQAHRIIKQRYCQRNNLMGSIRTAHKPNTAKLTDWPRLALGFVDAILC